MEAVGRDFFNTKVTMEILNQSEEDERTGKKEHVVFLVNQTSSVLCSKQSDSSTEMTELIPSSKTDHREITAAGKYIHRPIKIFLCGLFD